MTVDEIRNLFAAQLKHAKVLSEGDITRALENRRANNQSEGIFKDAVPGDRVLMYAQLTPNESGYQMDIMRVLERKLDELEGLKFVSASVHQYNPDNAVPIFEKANET